MKLNAPEICRKCACRLEEHPSKFYDPSVKISLLQPVASLRRNRGSQNFLRPRPHRQEKTKLNNNKLLILDLIGHRKMEKGSLYFQLNC